MLNTDTFHAVLSKGISWEYSQILRTCSAEQLEIAVSYSSRNIVYDKFKRKIILDSSKKIEMAFLQLYFISKLFIIFMAPFKTYIIKYFN